MAYGATCGVIDFFAAFCGFRQFSIDSVRAFNWLDCLAVLVIGASDFLGPD